MQPLAISSWHFHGEAQSCQTFMKWRCWEAVLYKSLVLLHCLQAQALTVFYPSYLFKDACITNNFGRWQLFPSRARGRFAYTFKGQKQCFLWSERQAWLLPIIKGSSSLSSGFHSGNKMHCVYKHHLVLCVSLCGNWALEICIKKGSYSGYCFCCE